jgi:hypothetical protein
MLPRCSGISLRGQADHPRHWHRARHRVGDLVGHAPAGIGAGQPRCRTLNLAGLVLGTGLVAAFLCTLLHRIVHHDRFRRSHEVGYAVFLQFGVIFAVLLAFVFNNVWSDYNVASQAIDSECASLHGIAILSDRLPSPARDAILDDLHAYLTTVLDREWPDMQRRNKSRAAAARFQLLWQTVETVNTAPADNQIRGQLLSQLATAHQSRETRLFQMTQRVPGLIWSLLIILASGLIGCMLVFAQRDRSRRLS